MAEFNVTHVANPIKLDGVKVTPEGKLETTAEVIANVTVDSVTATDVTISDPDHPDRKVTLAPDGSVNVTLSTALDKDYDSIDVGKMSKGGVYTAHNEVSTTATSDEIDCSGFNAVILHVVINGTGKWKIDVLNSTITNGTFVDAYDGDKQLSTGEINTSRSVLLRGITDYIKIKATEIINGATCTVKVQPLNV